MSSLKILSMIYDSFSDSVYFIEGRFGAWIFCWHTYDLLLICITEYLYQSVGRVFYLMKTCD
jgi:hypothetical protein